jgi:hypothetical protein
MVRVKTGLTRLAFRMDRKRQNHNAKPENCKTGWEDGQDWQDEMANRRTGGTIERIPTQGALILPTLPILPSCLAVVDVVAVIPSRSAIAGEQSC